MYVQVHGHIYVHRYTSVYCPVHTHARVHTCMYMYLYFYDIRTCAFHTCMHACTIAHAKKGVWQRNTENHVLQHGARDRCQTPGRASMCSQDTTEDHVSVDRFSIVSRHTNASDPSPVLGAQKGWPSSGPAHPHRHAPSFHHQPHGKHPHASQAHGTSATQAPAHGNDAASTSPSTPLPHAIAHGHEAARSRGGGGGDGHSHPHADTLTHTHTDVHSQTHTAATVGGSSVRPKGLPAPAAEAPPPTKPETKYKGVLLI